MPRGDGTGPAGNGPMPGRGAGYCAGNNQPGYMSARSVNPNNQSPPAGNSGSFQKARSNRSAGGGRGQGFARGRGAGHGNQGGWGRGRRC